MQAVYLAQSALGSGASTISSALPAFTTKQQRPIIPPPPPDPTPQELNLRRTARTLWGMSYGLLWLSLTSHGWQRAQYEGTAEVNGQTYHQSISAAYGVREVAFQLTTSTVTVPYASWNLAQDSGNSLPYTLILLVQCFMAVATVAGAGVCAAHVRAWCARTPEGTKKYTLYSAWAAIPQCLGSALAVLAWKCIDPEAFKVFCTTDGCLKETGPGVKGVDLYWAWVSMLASSVLALFVALTLWRLAHYHDDDDAEEVEVQLVNTAGGRNMRHHTANTTSSSHLVMGAKATTTPRSAAETWNPQKHQAQYAVVGKDKSGCHDPSQPSWLSDV